MKTEYVSFYNAFNDANKFVIPQDYQRDYVWNLTLCHDLLYDIRSLLEYEAKDNKIHFVGTILLYKTSREDGDNYEEKTYEIIDGQQRITTVLLLVLAIIHHAEEHGIAIEKAYHPISNMKLKESQNSDLELIHKKRWEEVQDVSRDGIKKGPWAVYTYFRHLLYLGDKWIYERNPPYSKPKKYKDKGSPKDQWCKWSNIDNQDIKKAKKRKGSKTPKKNTLLYEKGSLTAETETYSDSAAYIKGLLRNIYNNVKFNRITMESDDNFERFTIFDRLNGKRENLSSFDIIKNLIKSTLVIENDAKSKPDKESMKLWEQIEELIKKVPGVRLEASTSFVYEFLLSRGEHKYQENLKAEKVSVNFREHLKKRAPKEKKNDKSFQKFDLADYIENTFMKSVAIWVIAIGSEQRVSFKGTNLTIPKEIFRIIKSINNLSKGPAVPLILMYLLDYFSNNEESKVKDVDLTEKLELIEGFLIRYILSGSKMSPLRSIFIEFCNNLNDFDTEEHKLKQDLSVQRLRTVLKTKWKSDEIIHGSTDKNIYQYGTKVISIFAGLIRKSGSTIDILERDVASNKLIYAVEHIAPQDLSNWENDLKDHKVSIESMKQDNILHSIGNLTILSSTENSSISNSRFAEKQKFKKNNCSGGKTVGRYDFDDWVDHEGFWDPRAITDRQCILIDRILKAWPLRL